MNIVDEIFRAIRYWAKSERLYSRICTATEINETTRTLDAVPIDGGATIFDVRLQAAESGTLGFVPIPVVDSEIIISYISPELAYVSQFTELEKVLIDTDLVQFNGGTLDGLVTVNELITKINNLENKVNDIINLLQTWIVVPSDGGQALKTAAISSLSDLILTVKADIENDKITQ